MYMPKCKYKNQTELKGETDKSTTLLSQQLIENQQGYRNSVPPKPHDLMHIYRTLHPTQQITHSF